MMRTSLSAVLLPLAIASSAASSAEVPNLTPSELNLHADEYDGKTVRVCGRLSLQFEDVGFWDSKEAHDRPHEGGDSAALNKMNGVPLKWPTACVTVTGEFLDKVTKLESYPATVEGVFRKHIFPPDVISNQICNDTGLEVTKISMQNL